MKRRTHLLRFVACSPQHLVFDVGGTLLRGAIYDGTATPGPALTARVSANAPSYARHPDLSGSDLRRLLVAELSRLRATLNPRYDLGSIVVAFPGPIDGAGQVLAAPTLWGAAGAYPYALEDELRRAWPDSDVRVTNDVAAAGYRYVEKSDDDFCVVAVSTGIGNKVFLHGRPWVGRNGLGGEIGHLQVDTSACAPLCDCGGRGHLGAIASGRGALARASRAARLDERLFRRSMLGGEMGLSSSTLTAEALAAAYRREDVWSTALIQEGVDALALVFATIHLALGVDRFVLTGGFAHGLGAHFARAVQTSLRSRCWAGGRDGVSVMLGHDDGACALFGAGRGRHLGLL